MCLFDAHQVRMCVQCGLLLCSAVSPQHVHPIAVYPSWHACMNQTHHYSVASWEESPTAVDLRISVACLWSQDTTRNQKELSRWDSEQCRRKH